MAAHVPISALTILILGVAAGGCREAQCGFLYPPPPAACGADLSMYQSMTFAEPDAASEPRAFEVCDNVSAMWVDFPREANGGYLGRTYWLTGEEDMEIVVNLFQPTDVAGRGHNWLGRVLVDGRQTPIMVDGTSGMDFVIQPNDQSAARKALLIDSDALSDGAHTVVVLLTVTATKEERRRNTGWLKDGYWVLSRTFTALKNGTRFHHRPSPPATYQAWSEPARPGAHNCADCGPSAEGTLTVRFGVGDRFPACPDEVRGWSVVALLDGVEFPFGDLGFAPRFDVPGGQVAVFEATFRGLPVNDGLTHSLLVYQVPDGDYTEGPPGYPTAVRTFHRLIDDPLLLATWQRAANNPRPIPAAATGG